MSIVVTNRNEPLLDDKGIASLRFAGLLEEIVDTVNDLRASPINTQDRDYTFIITDYVVRKTGSVTQQSYTLPANEAVPFEIGTELEVQNDGTVDMDVDIDDDTLIFEDDGTTGKRTIAPDGSGRFLKVTATQWKCRGRQMT